MEEFQVSSFPRRLGAAFVDFLIIFLIWYFLTLNDVSRLDLFMTKLDPETPGALDAFATELFRIYTVFVLKYIFVGTLYYTLVPAIIGNGKSLGKVLFGLSIINANSGEEISPSRLMLREFVSKVLLGVLIVPIIISFFFTIFSKTSRTIHDRIGRTLVVRDSTFNLG